jgi:hypothetical protein
MKYVLECTAFALSPPCWATQRTIGVPSITHNERLRYTWDSPRRRRVPAPALRSRAQLHLPSRPHPMTHLLRATPKEPITIYYYKTNVKNELTIHILHTKQIHNYVDILLQTAHTSMIHDNNTNKPKTSGTHCILEITQNLINQFKHKNTPTPHTNTTPTTQSSTTLTTKNYQIHHPHPTPTQTSPTPTSFHTTTIY